MSDLTSRPARRRPTAFSRAGLAIGAALFALSALTVYSSFVTLAMSLPNASVRPRSLENYRAALEGSAGFPYQWRMLGTWLVRGGELATGLAPHAVDAVIRTATLAASAAAILVFASEEFGAVEAAGAIGFYIALTAIAFASQPYDIYFTNDEQHIGLIEINPFDHNTRASLFSWEKDH